VCLCVCVCVSLSLCMCMCFSVRHSPFVCLCLCLSVCVSKHGRGYYWALTREQLFKNALNILTNRFNDGHWYWCPTEDAPSEPEMTMKQIGELPNGKIKQAAKKLYHSWKRNWEQTQMARDHYKMIQEAVEAKDGQSAWGS